MKSALTGLLLILLLVACDRHPPVRSFPPDAYPQLLSEWGMLIRTDSHLVLGEGVQAYDLNTPLFTDYAQKLRTVWMPPGTAATYQADGAFDFPVGTIVSKTFFYGVRSTAPAEVASGTATSGMVQAEYAWSTGQDLPLHNVRLMETRLLVRQEAGWDALPYVWEGTDARLKIAGALIRVNLEYPQGAVEALPYIVPTRNECAACHATDHSTGELQPIGLKARHLNRAYLGSGENQLREWHSAGRLRELPALEQIARNADAADAAQSIERRARAYLDINCGHCHNPAGAADTSGLLLDASTTSLRALGLCKPPIAAGQGTGGRAFSIVPGQPDGSMLVFRMLSTDPGSRMPELGRSLAHREGVALVSEWIATLPGECIQTSAD
ncbi:MAG: SO2930 family diheme c-type cytochrome [Pseudomonadales bacterium]